MGKEAVLFLSFSVNLNLLQDTKCRIKELNVVTSTCNPSTWEAGEGDCCEFKVGSEYTVNSRSAWNTEQHLCKNKINR